MHDALAAERRGIPAVAVMTDRSDWTAGRRRWKVERLNAWLQNFRRIATRFDYYADNYLGFVHLGCIKILLRCYL